MKTKRNQFIYLITRTLINIKVFLFWKRVFEDKKLFNYNENTVKFLAIKSSDTNMLEIQKINSILIKKIN